MHISKEGLRLIQTFEGFSAHPYLCPGGVWTIGYGHTKGVNRQTKPITQDDAEKLLQRDVRDAERIVQQFVRTALQPHQFSALVSFVYNVGQGNFIRSSLLRHLNAGNPHRAADEFSRWVYASGKKLKGLERRRAAERHLFLGESS